MLWQRIISTICLWLLVLGLVMLRQPALTFLFVSLLAIIGQWEFYQMQESKGLHVFKKSGVFFGVALLVASYFELVFFYERESTVGWTGLSTLVVLLTFLGLFSRQVFEEDQDTPMATVALSIFGFFYVPFLFMFFLGVLFRGGPEMDGLVLAVYLVAITKMTDLGAYLTGKVFGRHKMSPQISPKKTWEGFAGGLVISLSTSIILVHFLPEQLALISGIHCWILGLIIPVISVVGDLAESVVKRDAKIKESGSLIPGIGGSLDLIDSLLFTAPLFYSYLLFVQ